VWLYSVLTPVPEDTGPSRQVTLVSGLSNGGKRDR
jgi:hypothetical protein